MQRAERSFHWIVKKIVPGILALAFALGAVAQEPPEPPPPPLGDRAEKLIKNALPTCSEKVEMTRAALVHKLPINMSGNVIQLKSDRQTCAGQWVAIVSREGGFYLGVPWFIEGVSGPTTEMKLKKFAWENLQQSYDPVIDRKPTREGLYKVTMLQTTERGKVPMVGEIDATGKIFFFGHFYPIGEDIRESRLKSFQPFLDKSPFTGSARPAVTVVEFSDFECPSCQRASGFVKPILEKYSDQVRYVRFDLPLLTIHPWAFAAAVAGRAIWQQKPDAFWEFKKQVYANQDKLTAFTFDEFARGFVEDHDLDVKKYDADIASADIQSTILGGVGAAFSNDVRATPTYLVNGTYVDPGPEGKALESYVAGLIKK
ncbi:MAG TPA: thioredoxin domain-containing protein [Thermoanaerobaculia bacterium]|nr:thioredoxin domain-containing protein [Thermoanaerobaculia bacterium]